MNLNYDDMLEQVKTNIKKVEEEGKLETQINFVSSEAASDFFYKVIKELDGWVIKSALSDLVPSHYQNSAVLVRNEVGVTTNEEGFEALNEKV